MQRSIDKYLLEWRDDSYRKPLILRGARQVGKTTAVRHLAQTFSHYVEINFERMPEVHAYFQDNLDPVRILENLHLLLGKKLIPGKTLLFLDEAQACPRAIIALRYFYEQLPELHVIAAGSLLDLAIEKVGVPVGRVSFLYMYPMSFQEFLRAMAQTYLADYLLGHDNTQPLSEPIHEKALRYFGEYMAIGGMPEVVALWRDKRDYRLCHKRQYDLVVDFEQDFPKYVKQAALKHLEVLLKQLPHQLAQPFKYAKIGEYRSRELSPALDALRRAGVVHKIHHSAGQGVPLAAQSSLSHFKTILLDVALTQCQLGLKGEKWVLDPANQFVNQGELVEAFVGQELLAYADPTLKADLYYWQRSGKQDSAEIDYLLQQQQHVIPIEVKAGKGTSMKSMSLFLQSHADSPYGIRFSTHNYSVHQRIHSYPLYAIAAAVAESKPG